MPRARSGTHSSTWCRLPGGVSLMSNLYRRSIADTAKRRDSAGLWLAAVASDDLAELGDPGGPGGGHEQGSGDGGEEQGHGEGQAQVGAEEADVDGVGV